VYFFKEITLAVREAFTKAVAARFLTAKTDGWRGFR
jgi:hypothetical protein